MKKVFVLVLLSSVLCVAAWIFVDTNENNFAQNDDIVYYKQNVFVNQNALDLRVLWVIVDDNIAIILYMLLAVLLILIFYWIIVIVPSPVGDRRISK